MGDGKESVFSGGPGRLSISGTRAADSVAAHDVLDGDVSQK